MTTVTSARLIPPTSVAVRGLATAPSYQPTNTRYVTGTPYRRPLDAERLAGLDWGRPLTQQGLLSDASLVANRLLMNIYESDALFLPASGLAGQEAAFADFYCDGNRLYADMARAAVESYVFGFLDADVQVTGLWDVDALEQHVSSAIDEALNSDRPVLRAIEESPDPPRAAELLITQMALDGLTEATAMSQNLGGAYGVEQSEMFKIFIDEFGYGVFGAKHSTLFAELCRSIEMNTEPHHYWFFYLPSWLAGNNYFYRVTRRRASFFRYVGAMAFLEATFASSFAAMTKTLRAVYGDRVDTRYCDEHAHIDQHHGRMAVHNLLLPLARKHGQHAIRDLVFGIEEARILGRLGDEDLLGQLRWQPKAVDFDAVCLSEHLVQLNSDIPFETRVADRETVVCVVDGEVELHWRPTGDPLILVAGQGCRVPKQRLFGLHSSRSSILRIAEGEQ